MNAESIRKGDSYIDKMLEEMLNNKDEKYNPYFLEDSAVGFYRKVIFMNVSGEAKLHDGYIQGLNTLHRVKHYYLHKEDDKLRVRAQLGVGELEFHYKGSVKFMNFGPTITILGILSYIEVSMEFKVNSMTGRDGKLTKLVIDDMRGMKLRVSSLGPINWAVNPIINGVTKIFKRSVRNCMEHKVKKHIAKHIPNYQFPTKEGKTTEITKIIFTQIEKIEETTPTVISPYHIETPEKIPVRWCETKVAQAPSVPKPEIEALEEIDEPKSQTRCPEETPEHEPETEVYELTFVPELESEAPEKIHESETETKATEETAETKPQTKAPNETPESKHETKDSSASHELESETDAPEPKPATEDLEKTHDHESETETP